MRFGVELKANNSLSDLAGGLALPVQQLTQFLASRIRARVVDQGASPDGSALPDKGSLRSSTGRAQQTGARWWVGPGLPQPAGALSVIATGEMAGWAVYRDYASYIAALPPMDRRRQGKRTGETWDSLRVRSMSPNRAKATFYGTRKTSKNAKTRIGYASLATLAARGLKFTFLEYSEGERQAVQNMAQEMLEGSLRGVLLGAASQRVSVRLRGFQGGIRR